MELLWPVLGLVAAFFVSQIIYDVFFSPLKSIPGPFLARLTRFWELYILRHGHSHMEFVRQHEKHGIAPVHKSIQHPLTKQSGFVVRVAPNRYSFSRPEDVKLIYSPGSKFPKSKYYEASGNPHQTNIFSTRDMADHSDRRRKVASLYTMSTMVAYESAVDRMTAVCLRKLGQIGREERPLSVPQFMQYYAFDVIGEITVSLRIGG